MHSRQFFCTMRNLLQALDPTTLAPLPEGKLQVAPHALSYAYPQVVTSADGSVLAAIIYGHRAIGPVTSGRDIGIRTYAGGVRRGPTLHPPVAMMIAGISPNGRQIAVLDGNSDTLTTIDAQTLSIESTVSVHRAASLLDRLLGIAGLAPAIAEAKEVKGTTLTMTLSPDGRSLLVNGTQGKRNAQGMYVATPLDLESIDVASGLIQADRAAAWISTPQFAPDGSAVYVVEPDNWTLLRLDPATLQTETTRVIGADNALEAYLLGS